MRIYTRTGDQGQTSLFGGQRVPKNALRVEAYGSVDELNAWLGWCQTLAADDGDLSHLLGHIQAELFALGADLATPLPEAGKPDPVLRMAPEQTAFLEQTIDRLETELEPLKVFILPGGATLAAALHVGRTVARRAERRCVSLQGAETINDECVRYLNRLSDLLFVMARVANRRTGRGDVPWLGGRR